MEVMNGIHTKMKLPWRKIIPAAMLAIVLLLILGAIALDRVLRTPHGARDLSAALLGADYLDDSGAVLQTNGWNCGAAALKMIFDRYSIDMTLRDIDARLQHTDKGTSLFALKELAEARRLRAVGWRLSYDDFAAQRFPIILFVGGDHFVVADSVREESIYLRDPAIGRVKILKHKLLKIWKGEALLFSRQ